MYGRKKEHKKFHSIMRWIGTREADFYKLSGLIGSKSPLLQVVGSHGSGKTTLVRDVLEVHPHVFINTSTCGSVAGVMSCILRRLAQSRETVKKSDDPWTPDLDEMKTDVLAMKEENRSPEEMDCTEKPIAQRSCRKETMKRIAQTATVRKGRTNGKRRFFDALIDEDSSDSDGAEGASAGESGDEMKSRPERVKNSKVSPEIHRMLARSEPLLVKTQSAFVQKLERLLAVLPDDPTLVVLDNVESLLTSDDFDIDPAASKLSGSDFLRLISRLSEYINYHEKLGFVLITCKRLPHEVSTRCITVDLHPYSAEECKLIMSRTHPELEEWFLNTAIAVMFPAITGNMRLLEATLLRIRRDEEITKASRDALVVKTKLACAREIRRLFGGGDSERSVEDDARDLEAVRKDTKWLSQTEKLVLLAGYLAAHNPPNQDKVIFRTVAQHAAPAGRRKTATTMAFRKGKLNADSINVRAPVPFNIPRLLNIYRYVSGDWESNSDADSGVLFQRTIRGLVQHGLFKSTASDDWLRGSTKLNCHAPHDLIELIACAVGVKLDEVLYG
jgi:hypothetical protein